MKLLEINAHLNQHIIFMINEEGNVERTTTYGVIITKDICKDPISDIRKWVEWDCKTVLYVRENWEEEITKRQNKKIVPVVMEFANERPTSDLEKLFALVEAQNKRLDDINSRLKDVERCVHRSGI
jgi:hypothetical protein